MNILTGTASEIFPRRFYWNMLLFSQTTEINCVTALLSNLVEFVLPRIYQQFLQISTSFSVEENPHAFVKIWFTEKHQCEPGESVVFCCSTPAVESDSSLTWNSLKKSMILVLEEKFLKNYLPSEIYASFTQVSSLIVFLYFCKISNEGITAC